MSSRYDDRDYDREGQNRGRRSESDYGRSWGGRSQGRYRYGDNEREDSYAVNAVRQRVARTRRRVQRTRQSVRQQRSIRKQQRQRVWGRQWPVRRTWRTRRQR